MKKTGNKPIKKNRKESITETLINNSKKLVSETIGTGKKILTDTKSVLIDKADVIIEAGKQVAKFIVNTKAKIIDANSINKKREPVNIICIKYSNSYGPEYVNRLFNMVLTNINIPFRFYCFTDDSSGIDERVIIKDIPVFKDSDGDVLSGFSTYNKDVGFCSDDLGGYELRDKRVLVLDLDVIITDNIDDLFSCNNYPDEFIITKDFSKGQNNTRFGQASCYSFRVGTLGYIKEYYENNMNLVHKKYKTSSQVFF